MLISRKSAQWVCGLGLLQLIFATGLTICGFIILGMFHKTSCVGIWLGLPMMIPCLCSVIVLGTRKKWASLTVILCNVIILAVACYHMYVVYEECKYWKKYRDFAESDAVPQPCYDRGDHCVCLEKDEYLKMGYRVQYCNQFRLGDDIFWTMMGLTVGGALFSLLNIFVGIGSLFSSGDKPELRVN